MTHSIPPKEEGGQVWGFASNTERVESVLTHQGHTCGVLLFPKVLLPLWRHLE